VNDGIDLNVVNVLNGATQRIDIASFDLNLPSVVNALVAASQRGVAVRVVIDGENGEQELDANRSPDGKLFKTLDVLKKAKIKVVDGGRSNGLMHDKIILVDGKTLFMGSWNTSYNDTFRNNNNLLQITAPALIANYQAKFDELYSDQRFGAKAEVGAQKSALFFDGVLVENYFSPPDKVMDKLVKYVGGAKRSVHFIIFTYTDANLAAAMIERAKAGVDVQGVIENRGASQGALVPLACAKLPVKVDGNKYTMHHKVIIVDGEFVITGSYNFTKSADVANDDNVLVIHSQAVAALYEQEYARVNSIAQAPDATGFDCSKTK
jgi:phosphatidylserine/phosphatidylglycerophosphate/cardiolipin synthase-like enzyme